jgi:hypothetical protein
MVGINTESLLQPGQPVRPGAVIFEAGTHGGCWRVQRGIVRLDRVTADGPVLVMLALPGDWLGSDTLCQHPHQWRATAVSSVLLQPREPVDVVERQRWLIEALLQQPERCHDMARLRTGPVVERLRVLLRLFAQHVAPRGRADASAPALREVLPPLRVLAELVDAKHETVCRTLAQLLPRERPRVQLAAAA